MMLPSFYETLQTDVPPRVKKYTQIYNTILVMQYWNFPYIVLG